MLDQCEQSIGCVIVGVLWRTGSSLAWPKPSSQRTKKTNIYSVRVSAWCLRVGTERTGRRSTECKVKRVDHKNCCVELRASIAWVQLGTKKRDRLRNVWERSWKGKANSIYYALQRTTTTICEARGYRQVSVSMGIELKLFNPFRPKSEGPFLRSRMNLKVEHRKCDFFHTDETWIANISVGLYFIGASKK